jgi:hypothetical protein
VVAFLVAITWLYAHTKGSLLLTMLMHSAVNQTVGIVPSANANPGNPFALSVSLVMWLTVAFLWATALYFLVRMPKVESHADKLICKRHWQTVLTPWFAEILPRVFGGCLGQVG